MPLVRSPGHSCRGWIEAPACVEFDLCGPRATSLPWLEQAVSAVPAVAMGFVPLHVHSPSLRPTEHAHAIPSPANGCPAWSPLFPAIPIFKLSCILFIPILFGFLILAPDVLLNLDSFVGLYISKLSLCTEFNM